MKVSQAQITALECDYKAAQEETSAAYGTADILYSKLLKAQEQLRIAQEEYDKARAECDRTAEKECYLEARLDAAYLARDWADISI